MKITLRIAVPQKNPDYFFLFRSRHFGWCMNLPQLNINISCGYTHLGFGAFRGINGLGLVKSELDKSVFTAWVGSPAQSQMSLYF